MTNDTAPPPHSAAQRRGPDTMLARIRKLLALAEDAAATPAEAAAFTEKAAALIARYGIDRARLAVTDPTTDHPGDRILALEPPYARDKFDLLAAVATPLRCRAVRLTRWVEDGKRVSAHVFGMASDLDRTEVLFTSLLVQAARGLAATPVPEYDHPAAFRRSWLAGFSQAVRARLATAEARAASDEEPGDRAAAGAPSMAVVLASRTSLVEARLAATYPRVRPGRARTLWGSGQGDGWVAGHRADLGGTRLAGRPPAALP